MSRNNIDIKQMRSLFIRFYKKFWYVSKLDICLFVCTALINAVLESLGLFLIWPVIAIFIDKQGSLNSALGQFLSKHTKFNPGHTAIFAAFAIGGVYILKNLVLLASNLREVKSFAKWKSQISNRVYAACLYAPLEFHNRRSGADLANLILFTIPYVINQFISQFFQLISNVILCITVIGILAYLVSPMFFSIIFFATLLLIASHKSFKYFYKYLGQRSMDESNKVFSVLGDTFQAYKELHVYQASSVYKQEFIKSSNNYIKTEKWTRFLEQAPGLMNEIIFVNVLIVCMYFMAQTHTSADMAFKQLGILVVTFFRLIPALNKIYTSVTMMRSACEPLENLLNTMNEIECYASKNLCINEHIPQPSKQQLKNDTLISIINADFSYGMEGRPSVNNVSIEFKQGSINVLVGPSGGGKSTLLNAAMGFLPPTNGEVIVDGQSMQDILQEWWQRVAIVTQNFNILNFSIAENIAFGKKLEEIDMHKVDKVLRETDLSEFVNSLPEGSLSNVGHNGKLLSEGQRQRLAICRALYFEKDVWILDEVTSALDLKTENVILNLLKSFAGKVTIIMAAHRPSVFKHADHVIFMRNGRVVMQGHPDVLLVDSPDFSELVKESTRELDIVNK